MPLSALTGTKLRDLRLAQGLRQADVAQRAGISASYLNLIEHNRRKVTPEVMERLADAIGIDRSALAEGRNAALVEDLRSAAARGGSLAEVERVEDFVDRFPGWAGLLASLEARSLALERAVEALNDRMSHDPHLSASLHELLSSLAAVRATAAILAETPDLDAEWAARFHRNLHQDSERLAAGAEALVGFLDARQGIEEQGIAAPQEEVEDWLRGRGWRISDAELQTGLAEEIAGLASSAARSLAGAHVARARADAGILPEAPFAAALAEIGPDPLALAARFAAAPLAVMRRLAGRPEVQAGLVLCDGSGTLTFRKPAIGFPLPRFGAACPLWPLYAALGRPMQPVEARVQMAGQGDRRHRVIAWAETRHPQGLRGPELREAAMLILPDAGEGPVLRIGSSCRVCVCGDCPARREPSILPAEAIG
ncbi:helix-turn-helix domain-containing protein [Rhodobacter calidifons]|uniref:Helix-turn-helix domain-containing protein n=1 Tax=Rhodobacter calidifons TaxID=2715277 RepID=A0ABX0G8I8_9RHOB|nr:helix-turn-helix transcriptional regulator [Rhodobacter calidifons]NHB77189.1 helix-turn-helix domain-containing protein [Rhodobacter calidifons]